jgi:hypothetical protein
MPRHATRRLTATKSPKVDPGRLDQAKVLGGRTVCSGLLGRERDRAAPRFARSGEALYAVLGGWSGLVSRAAAWSVAEGPCAGCSDSGAAEHLAGILARESSVLERIRTGGSDTGAEQPIIALARVHVHRPLAPAVVADYPSAV